LNFPTPQLSLKVGDGRKPEEMTKRVAPEPKAQGGKAAGKAARNKAVEKPSGVPAVAGAWSMPVLVTEVPETGRHVELVPDDATRQAIAQEVGLVALPRVAATFDLTRRGADSLRVEGRVTATVVQNCVVTLEPIESEIDEPVELFFRAEPTVPAETGDEADFHPVEGEEPPEPLVNGMVDLGTIATEFLNLGIDPYPRKEGVVFDAPPAGDPASHPFAALAALKKDSGPKGH
jgi:uncharacterized metal-binding protein YceD (DUF177 family)